MKSFAECALEDKRITNHCYRNYRIMSSEEKLNRSLELIGDKTRIDGRLEMVGKNRGTSRATQTKRGM